MAELAASSQAVSALADERGAVPSPLVARLVRPSVPRLVHLSHRLAVAAAVLVLVAAVALVAFRLRYDGKVLPSIVVADVEVGGLSREAAEAAVVARSDQLLTTPLSFDYDGRRWTPTLAELGVSADSVASVDAAYAVGREAGARDRLASSFDSARRTHYVPLAMTVDRAAADAWADAVTDELGLAPRDAEIEVEGGAVTLRPDVDGIVVDAGRLAAIVDEAIRTMTPYRGPLPIVSVPAGVPAADLEAEAGRLETALSQPVTIVYKKEKWRLRPADLGRFVLLTPREGGGDIAVDLDRDALADWLMTLVAEDINRDPRDAVVAWNGDRLGVVEGSRDGLRVRPDTLARDVAASFFGGHEAVPIPVRTLKPDIDDDNLEDLGIEGELGRGTSNFAGSNDGRSTNVVIGTGYLNGAMVKPGGDFSFNEAVGDITEEAGYVEAQVIQGERIGKDIGGGICQVSTTVFRAAYTAGLPMVEWNPHLYRLTFYELDGYSPGYDASILQAGPRESWGDFRFRNPTDGWLLVESYIVDTVITVVIYGPETGWDISFSDPVINTEGFAAEDQPDIEVVDPNLAPGTVEQGETAIDGMEVTHRRTVTDADGTVVDDFTFYTRYAARGDLYKVSPDMEGESPAAAHNAERDLDADEPVE